jgi:imidazolonepropionase-like amidohydrolase
LIKIWTSGGVYSETNPGTSIEFTPAEVKSMTEEAHRAGIQVASHAHGAEGIRMAVENGVDTIEHGTYLDEEGCQLMCENDAILVPTFSLAYRYANVGAEHGVTSELVEMSTEVVEDRITATKNAYEYDVDIAFGTDFCGPEIVPHGTNAMEARLLVDEVGMDGMDVIKSATSVAGRTLPTSNVGTIEPGKYADLLVLEENPVNDITELERVNEVYVSGERQNAI